MAIELADFNRQTQVGLLPLDQQAHALPLAQKAQAAEAVQHAKVGPEAKVVTVAAERHYKMGLESPNGHFTDFTQKMSREDKRKMVELLAHYSQGSEDFKINLSDLKNGDGRVLPEIPGRDFEQDMKDLRAIAQRAVGVEHMHWKSYPQGYRAIVGESPAFELGRSARLREHFDFNDDHLQKWLEEIRDRAYVPNENDTPEEQEKKKTEWETNKDKRVTEEVMGALKGFCAARGLMEESRAWADGQLAKLEDAAKKGTNLPGLGSRIERLREFKAKLPVGHVPTHDADAAKELRGQGQVTKGAAILYAASHPMAKDESPDLEARRADAQKHLESFDAPGSDLSGYFTSPKKLFGEELLPETAELERNFVNSMTLLSLDAPDRAAYESFRKGIKSQVRNDDGQLEMRTAQELSDGPEWFFAQNARAIATDPSRLAESFKGVPFDLAFGSIKEEDQADAKNVLSRSSTKLSTAINGIKAPTMAELADMGAFVRNFSKSLGTALKAP